MPVPAKWRRIRYYRNRATISYFVALKPTSLSQNDVVVFLRTIADGRQSAINTFMLKSPICAVWRNHLKAKALRNVAF